MDKSLGYQHDCGVKLTAAYKRVGDCWAAWVEEIPGVHTQGDTLEEARENLKDALRMVLEANRELSEKAYVWQKLGKKWPSRQIPKVFGST